MVSVYGVFLYLLRKQKYTVLYLLMRKLLGPQLLHPCYSRPPLQKRLLFSAQRLWAWYGYQRRDYFLEAWELV